MWEPTLVYPVMMYQRQVDVTEQQYVRRDSRMLLFQGNRPHLTSNCPRWKKLLKAGRLNVPMDIMRPPNMIHIIMWRAFPHCALRHWTPDTATIAPSLSETLPHVDTCHTSSMCRSKHNYLAESDGIAA